MRGKSGLDFDYMSDQWANAIGETRQENVCPILWNHEMIRARKIRGSPGDREYSQGELREGSRYASVKKECRS